MSLYSTTVRITTSVAKKYKMNYVKILQNLAEDIYMNIYRGNNKESIHKKEMLLIALEDISIYNEFTLQAEYDGCLTVQQKCELDQIIDEVQRMLKKIISGLESWANANGFWVTAGYNNNGNSNAFNVNNDGNFNNNNVDNTNNGTRPALKRKYFGPKQKMPVLVLKGF